MMHTICLMLVVVVGVCSSQSLKQCTCAEVAPCKEKAVTSFIPCADKCQKHAGSAGADYQTLRGCVMGYRPQIEATLQCVVDQFKGSCSATPTNKQVPKRYANGIEIAIMSEINGVIADNGISAQVAKYVGHGRKYAGCVQKCIGKQSNDCAKKASCGLDLPSDTEIAKIIKNCAVQKGVLNTKVIQSLCNCAIKAGAGGLANICPSLVIKT